ncbi:putative dsRNA-binding protein [Streptomyces sp. NPDC001275]
MNRWVGIVSLRETAAPTPVHRIALAIEAARKRTSYRLAGRKVPYARMRSALRTLGQEHARRYEWDRYTYCVELAGDFYDGGEPPVCLPFWLTAELQDLLDGRHGPRTGGRGKQSPPKRAPRPRRADRHRPPSSFPGQGRKSSGPGARHVPPRAAHRAPPEPAPPYVRAERQLGVRDVTYPALSEPPAALVGTFGETVRTAIRDAVGEWDAGVEATAWLGLAATHRSHLYERGLAETAVTPNVLGMLDQLGRSTLGVILIDAWVAQRQPEKVGVQSSEHNRRWMAARRALGQWAAERGLVRMGAGEAQRPAPSVAEGVARQILGVLSLTDAHETARRLVETVCADIDGPADGIGGADPVTEAQTLFAKEGLSYEYAEDGPDHAKSYTATARTGRARSAQGTGRNKKTARTAAARALLRSLPQARRPQAGQVAAARLAVPPQPYRNAPRRYRDAVTDLAAMFELDDRRAEALLAQALTHASYVYENQAEAAAHHQRDNQLLAHHGSLVLDHLARHARTRHVLAHGLVPDEDEARIHTPANEDTARLGTALALADGVLTGRGEDGQRPGKVADAAQAVAATAWRVHGPSLLHRRPAVLDGWLSGLQHQHHPVTVMNYLVGMFGMTHAFEYECTSPDHLQAYASTLVLHDVRGRVQRWTVPPDGPCSKTDADKATAQDVLEILAAPTDDLVDALTPAERDLLRYLLRAQLDGLGQTNERQRARMVSGGLLGTDLLATGDLDAFRAWTARVGALLGAEGAAVPHALPELYRHVLRDTRFGPRSLLRRMAADQGSDRASTVRRNAAEAVGNAARTGPWGVTVRDIVQDWWRDQAARTGVTVRDDMRQEDFLPLPVQLAALDETLTWCGEVAEAAGSSVDVELTVQDGTLHTWIGLHGVDARAACDDFARLLSRTLPCTDCIVDDDHVLLRLHSRPDTESLTPLAAAGIDAYLAGDEAASRPPVVVPGEEPAAADQEGVP